MLHLNDFDAWLEVDGEELTAYNVEISDDRLTATCWIPSEAGKTFSVKWKTFMYPVSVAGWVSMDGTHCGGKLLVPDITAPAMATAELSSVLVTNTTTRPFIFSPLELTDDDAYLGGSVKDIGEIVLELWNVVAGELSLSEGIHVPEADKVHERSKKGIAHRIKFGEIHETPHTRFISVNKLACVAKFVFKYRSIEILRANGIAPPDHKVGGKRKAASTDIIEVLDSDSEDELKVLEKRVNALKAKKEKKSTKFETKKVKSEHRSVFIPGEVIDLT